VVTGRGPGRGRATRWTVALACAALVLALLPAGAHAHAVVEQTQPTRGAALKQAPERVWVTFDEPVESSFGALRVFAADGGRVDVGEVRRPTDDTVAVAVEDDLPDGAYTVTYRVVSADSHPVTGGYVFTVGKAGGTPAAAVADLLEDGAGPVTEVAFGIVRAVSYGAIALLAGGLAFLLLVWLPALRRAAPGGPDRDARWADAARAFHVRTVRLLVAAAVAGMVATVLGIVLQAATATGGSLWSALDSGLIHDVLNTRFGEVWKLRFTAFGVLAALLLFLPPATASGWMAAGHGKSGPARWLWVAAFATGCAYLVVSPALGGHAGAADDSALLVPLDVLHVAAMSVWVGGVALLLLAVPAATRVLEPVDRTRLLASAITRFSTVAIAAVAALLATGVVQSILHLDSWADLVDTAFGRAILIKVAIFVALIALGAYNRRRSQPQLARLADGGEAPGRAGVALRRALRAEVGLMVAVLAVTAALVSYSPSAGATAGPFSDSADLGPARIELTVDPARAGSNEIHVYLFDARSGAQYDRPRRLSIAARDRERDIGPIALDVQKAGPGHYTVARADLAPAGDWTLTVRAPISDFEELRTDMEVPIR
jgi:copper transport protein